MFHYQQNLSFRAKLLKEKKRKKAALKQRLEKAKTVKQLRGILMQALEEGIL